MSAEDSDSEASIFNEITPSLEDEIDPSTLKEEICEVDHRPGTYIRSNIFGHPKTLVPLSNGRFAKKVDPVEATFYLAIDNEFSPFFDKTIVPTIYGTGFTQEERTEIRSKGTITFYRTPKISIINCNNMEPYLFEEDVLNGFEKPAVIDIKIGMRSWRLNACEPKIKRRKWKLYREPTEHLNFRVRAAMFYSDNPKYKKENGISYVKREFGSECSEEDLMELMREFLHQKKFIKELVLKLRHIGDQIKMLRDNYGVRLYSSSILIAYDDANPDKFACKMIDFVKTYIGIENYIKESKETLEDCDDYVVEGIMNLADFIEKNIVDNASKEE